MEKNSTEPCDPDCSRWNEMLSFSPGTIVVSDARKALFEMDGPPDVVNLEKTKGEVSKSSIMIILSRPFLSSWVRAGEQRKCILFYVLSNLGLGWIRVVGLGDEFYTPTGFLRKMP